MAGDILKNKAYLYVTEFFCGMAVMAVELAANRLIAPYFSSSQIVWTIIIGTIMIAMAAGNVLGGIWADKDPDPAKLFRRILIAGVWIAAIPLVGKYVIVAITGLLIVTISTNLLIWAAFIACLALFVVPLFLLGTVTPSLIKYTVESLEESGSIAGRLGACNTVGSIIGTFLPTFVTIPAVGTAVTFLLFSGTLLAIALVFFIASGTRRAACAVAVAAFCACCAFGHADSFAFWEEDLTYEGESIYNYLQVKDTAQSTSLSTNVMFGVQSVKMKQADLTGMYYDYALAAPVMVGKDDPSVLVLGMGTGTYATQVRHYFALASVEGVEIDDKITQLAYEYFDLDEAVQVTTYDGRAYLNATQEKYDVIMVDAYQDITIPFQMSTLEFFSMVAAHLNDGGVMVVNLNMQSGDDGISAHISDTIAAAFMDVRVVDVPGYTNRVLFASNDAAAIDSLGGNALTLGDSRLSALMQSVDEGLLTWESQGRVLTDDKAPVELMGMQAIDSIIQGEAGYYREVFEERGLQGLLDSV